MKPATPIRGLDASVKTHQDPSCKKTRASVLATQDDVDSGEDKQYFRGCKFSGAIAERVPVQRNDLGNVRYRGLRQTCVSGAETKVARRRGPFEIARQRNADDGRDAASIESIALHDDDRATETRL